VRIRNLRFLTHLFIVCFCGLTVIKAQSLFRYVLAASANSGESRATALSPYFSTSGVAAQAMREAYPASRPASAADAAERVKLVSAMLAQAPLSSSDWLSLAQLRHAAGEGPERVVSALALSTVTGPNEGYVMYRRAPFELQIWDQLPHEGVLAAARDIASLAPLLSDQQFAALRKEIAARSDEARQFLKDALERTYALKPDYLKQLGLASAQDQPSAAR
jgi:hypothetical protein